MLSLDLNCPNDVVAPAEAIADAYSAVTKWFDATWAPDSDARKSLFTKALYGSLDDLLQRHPQTNNTLFDDAIANKDVCVLLALVSRLAFLTSSPASPNVQPSPCIGSTSSGDEEGDTTEDEEEEIAANSLTRICRPVRLSSFVEISEDDEPASPPTCTNADCDLPGNRHCSKGQCQRHCIERLLTDEGSTCRVSYHRARARAEREEEEERQRRRKRRRLEQDVVKRSKRIKNRHTNAPRCEAPQCKMHSRDDCVTGRCSEHCANIQWRNRGIRCPQHPPHQRSDEIL